MSAWITQNAKQVKKHGEAKASWYCEWDEPDGTRRCKSCGPGAKGKKAAEQLRDRLKLELLTGNYKRHARKKWSDFRKECEQRITPSLAATTQEATMHALNHFERILKLKEKFLSNITTAKIDDYRAKRMLERGRKPGSKVSLATINKELRHIKAVIRVAVEWGYMEAAPKFKFLKEPKRLPRYVTPEHFAAIYAACETHATKPEGFAFTPAEWWQGLLVMAQMTGWRIGELLALEWRDVDLEECEAVTRATDNKGKRDEKISLHPVVVDHLRPLKSFSPNVFPWKLDYRSLYPEFAIIQDGAGIYLPCDREGEPDHGECTDACHRYAFHDERRSFATLNAPNMTREALQALMRHQSPLTTARYINMARQLNPAVASLHVPDVLKVEVG